MDVITLGESMVLFEPMEGGNLQYAPLFRKTIGGAESNVAIGLSKLGHRASWISKLGDDPFGRYIYSYIKGEGVAVDHVQFVKEKNTAVFFKETGKYKQTNIYYYRKESAASTLSPKDLDEKLFERATFLHLTGITPALSDSCSETVFHAIQLAKKHNVQIVFDPNIRFTLDTNKTYFQTLREIAYESDYFLPGEMELVHLFPHDCLDECANKIIEKGVRAIIVKKGKDGATIHTKTDHRHVEGYPNDDVVDPVGAGDGFAAGFISGLLEKKSIVQAVERGNLVGSMVTMVKGDCEGLPYRKELNDFLNQQSDINR